MTKYFVAGGCGFIGSELVHKLLKHPYNKVVVYDNFSTGNIKFLYDVINRPNLNVIVGEISNQELLNESMKGCDVVYHLASNADISKAITEPTLDFYNGTVLTNNILEAMRVNNISKIFYASGSGVYGRIGNGSFRVKETVSKDVVSTYGASKLASEALIKAYCEMFNMKAVSFRFANVVGKNSTHGVIKDFIQKLKNNSEILDILGDGNQTKAYIHVSDAVHALTQMKNSWESYDAFNISCDSEITVFQIAKMIVKSMGLKNVAYRFNTNFTDGRGWKGDVPIIRMDSHKAELYEWKAGYTSTEAVQKAINEMLDIK